MWSLSTTRRVPTLLCVVALCLLVVAGCGDDEDEGNAASAAEETSNASGTPGAAKCDPSKDKFVILAATDTSGPTKAVGELQTAGLEAGAKYVNEERGGIAGACAEVTKLNTTGDPATASQVLLKYLSSNDEPGMVWPGSTTPEVAGTLPIVVRSGVFTMSPSHLGDQLITDASTKYKHVFTVRSPDTDGAHATAVVKWAQEVGAKKVGILQQDYPLGELLAAQSKAALESAGIDSVIAKFPSDALDVTPQASKLKAANVDALHHMGVGPSVPAAVNGPAKVGLEKLPFLITASTADFTKIAEKPEVLANAKILSPVSDAQPPDDDAVVAMKKYMAPTRPGALPISIPAFAWDSVIATNKAATQAGAADAESLTKALESLKETEDPLYLFNVKVGGFTADNHENVDGIDGSWVVSEIGPYVDGILTPEGS